LHGLPFDINVKGTSLANNIVNANYNSLHTRIISTPSVKMLVKQTMKCDMSFSKYLFVKFKTLIEKSSPRYVITVFVEPTHELAIQS